MPQITIQWRFRRPRRLISRLAVLAAAGFGIGVFPWFYSIPLFRDEACGLAPYILSSLFFHLVFCWVFQFIFSGNLWLTPHVFELVSLASVGYYIFWSFSSVMKDHGGFEEQAAKHFYAIEDIVLYRVALILLLSSLVLVCICQLLRKCWAIHDSIFVLLSLCDTAFILLFTPPAGFYLVAGCFAVFLFYLLVKAARVQRAVSLHIAKN